MKIKTNFILFTIFGLILMSTFSITYAQVSLESTSINAAGTNSTGSSLSLYSTIGGIAQFIQSTSFKLFAGFLPTTQGGDVIQPGLFSGTTVTVNADGDYVVPSGSSSGSMDFSEYPTFNPATDTVFLQQDFFFTDGGSLGGTVTIQAATTITRVNTAGVVTDWDGTFLPPIIQSTEGVVSVGGGIATQVIRVGLVNGDFSLDNPVRIVFNGRAGQIVGVYNSAGSVTEITTVCNADDFATTDAQLAARQSCKINTNNNQVVWTKRLSEFVTFQLTSSGEAPNTIAPSTTQGFLENEFPLVIGNTKFSNLGDFSKPSPTATLKTGTEIPVTLLLSDDEGPQNVDHAAIYFGPGKEYDVQFSKVGLVFDKGKDLVKYDPNGLVKDAYASTSVQNGKFQITFYITFAKSLETSDIVIKSWDINRNGMSVLVPKAISILEEKSSQVKAETGSPIVSEQMTPEPGVDVVPEPGVDVVPEPGVDIITPDQKEVIQQWAGFHTKSASDSELLQSLNINTGTDSTPEIPQWAKNNLGKWVLEDRISMKEFHNAINYVVKKVPKH